MKKQEAECPKEKEANKTFKPKSEPLIQEKEKLQRNTSNIKDNVRPCKGEAIERGLNY